MKKAKYTFQQFMKQFPDNRACLMYLFKSRFPKAKCPKCKRVNAYHLQTLKKKKASDEVRYSSHFVCSCGAHQLSPKEGTIYEKSDTDLQKWFFAMFLMSAARNGVSAKELERQLGVTYKCAWRIAHQIRLLMKQVSKKRRGTFEADETYVGGRSKGTVGRGTKKAPVFGVMKRGGGVYAKAVPNVKRTNVMPIIRENVKVGSTINTDEYHLYKNALTDYEHLTVRHGSKEYVRGKAHTNTLEGFWSHVKGSIRGTHRHVSKKYLQAYLDQFTWTWNRRASGPLFGALLEASV